jgi:hypothetical protein
MRTIKQNDGEFQHALPSQFAVIQKNSFIQAAGFSGSHSLDSISIDGRWSLQLCFP